MYDFFLQEQAPSYQPEDKRFLIEQLKLFEKLCQVNTYPLMVYLTFLIVKMFLPPANEVWDKVIFLHLFVILFTGGCLLPGGLVQGVGMCLVRGGASSWGVCLVETPLPPDGYCCGRYASYWNAFLLNLLFHFFFQQGRNQHCIDSITNKHRIITWDVVFKAVSYETLPDDIRAAFCNLMISMLALDLHIPFI